MASRLVLLLVIPLVLAAESAYRLDVVEKTPAPKEVAPAIRALLTESALRLRDAEGQLLAEVWLRKQVPAEATDAQIGNGLTYEEIPETTLLGVVHFPGDVVDYRKQRVPAGVYTLRLAVQPQVGDHDGTAPYPNFALVSRTATDRAPDLLAIEQLRKRSAEVTEGHPSPWLLFPGGKDAGPTVKLLDKGKGHWVLFWKQDVQVGRKSASLGFGLTLIGVSAAR